MPMHPHGSGMRHAGLSHLTRTARVKVGVGQPDYASGCLPGCQHLQYDMIPSSILRGMAGQIWGKKGGAGWGGPWRGHTSSHGVPVWCIG